MICRLLGFALVQTRDGRCLVYQKGELVGLTAQYTADSYGSYLNLYEPQNMHFAWRVAAFGSLYLNGFTKWWTESQINAVTSPQAAQEQWLDKFLELSMQNVAQKLAACPGTI